MFRAIKSFLGLTDDAPARPATARPRLGCERLETREVLSAYMSGSTLTIVGSSGVNDDVRIADGFSLLGPTVSVSVNGRTSSFQRAQVQRVYCNTLGGNDRIVSLSSVPSTLEGGDGDDYIRGGRGADLLKGGTGNDTIISIDQSVDQVSGGTGVDSFWVNGTSASVTINDSIADVETTEGRNVHRVGGFANGADMTLNGDDIADPTDGRYYERFDGPLFSKYGPLMQDVHQGETGDCWLLATLSSAARQSPDTIRQTIVELGDGTYAVGLGDKFYRVDADLPTTWYSSDLEQGADLGTDGALWVPLIEKAWTHHTGRNTYGGLNSLSIADAFESLRLTYDARSYYAPSYYGYNISIQGAGQRAMDDIAARLGEGRIVALSMLVPSDDTPCIGSHAYAVQGVSRDASGKVTSVTLRNPWGKDGAGSDSNPDDGYVRLTADMFAKSTWQLIWSTDAN